MSRRAPESMRWYHWLYLRFSVLVLAVITRALDLAVLVLRPRLLVAYLRIWWAEFRSDPYRYPTNFEARRALKASGQNIDELVYGEAPLVTALFLLRRAGVQKGSTVVDVGAGRGRVLLAARYLGADAVGYELLHQHVKQVAGALASVGAKMIEADATTASYDGATHIFLNWCGLSGDTQAKLLKKLARCDEGTRAIAVTMPVSLESYRTFDSTWAIFTWGAEPIYLQSKLANE